VSVSKLQHEKNIKNLEGSFGVEGIVLTNQTRKNLALINDGKCSSQDMVNKIIRKYTVLER